MQRAPREANPEIDLLPDADPPRELGLCSGRVEEESNRRFSKRCAIGIARRVVGVRRVVVLNRIGRRLEEGAVFSTGT